MDAAENNKNTFSLLFFIGIRCGTKDTDIKIDKGV